jgi:hypothetical protein
MPRYDPQPEQEPLLQPQQTVPRYQQLNIEQSLPPRQPRPYMFQHFFENIIPNVSKLLLPFKPNRKIFIGYSAGFLFALGWWIFIDGAVYNSSKVFILLK